MEHFVEFEDVCKYYQTGSVKIAAADHLNFYVDKGEFCIIVGPSGAGKTTLLNILGGMDSCDEGNVWLDGQNVSHFTARELTTYRRYDVGFVFQFYNLVQNLTAPAGRRRNGTGQAEGSPARHHAERCRPAGGRRGTGAGI